MEIQKYFEAFTRTTAETLAKTGTLVAVGLPPKQVYNKLLLESSMDAAPRNTGQVKNTKYSKSVSSRKANKEGNRGMGPMKSLQL